MVFSLQLCSQMLHLLTGPCKTFMKESPPVTFLACPPVPGSAQCLHPSSTTAQELKQVSCTFADGEAEFCQASSFQEEPRCDPILGQCAKSSKPISPCFHFLVECSTPEVRVQKPGPGQAWWLQSMIPGLRRLRQGISKSLRSAGATQ